MMPSQERSIHMEKLYKMAAEEGIKIHTNINLNAEKLKKI